MTLELLTSVLFFPENFVKRSWASHIEVIATCAPALHGTDARYAVNTAKPPSCGDVASGFEQIFLPS